MVRRTFDLVIALPLMLLAWPVLLLCALAIKLDSRGPVFFRQARLGRDGREFLIWKLRTMVEGADRIGAGLYTEPDDSRFTRVGLFLRRWSLDELPQLLNVLAGAMSLVGPRPLPKEVVDRYPVQFAEILSVKPGLTGYSQIRGRSAVPRSERLRMDRYYVRNRSLGMDLGILLRTVVVVLTGRGQENYGQEHEVER